MQYAIIHHPHPKKNSEKIHMQVTLRGWSHVALVGGGQHPGFVEKWATKKTRPYFRWNPGCFKGILIMAFLQPPPLWLGSTIPYIPNDNQGFFSLLISNHGHYCWCFRNPVKSPLKFGSLCHYLQGFIHLQVVCGISEPSTVSSIHVIKSRKSWILSSSTGWSFNQLIFPRFFFLHVMFNFQ